MPKQRWGCIYKLTNTINGKIYIGKTVNFKARMKQHKHSFNKKRCSYFARAVKKHGWINFKCSVLIDDVPEEDLDNLETSYIELLKSTNNKVGYNICSGGEGTSGLVHSDETKRKMSETHRSMRPTYGSVCKEKRTNKWRAKANVNRIEIYLGDWPTKNEAQKAIKYYYDNGKRLLPRITMRRKGTGHINLNRSGTYTANFKGKNYGTYKTKQEAEDVLVQHYK